MPLDWREKPRGGAKAASPAPAKKLFSKSKPKFKPKPGGGGATAVLAKRAATSPAGTNDQARATKKRPFSATAASRGAQPKGAKDAWSQNKRHQAHTAAQAREARHEKLVRCNKLWNELRQDDTTPERRVELSASIVDALKGKLVDYTLRADTSRVIQSCFKFGSPELRTRVLAELQGHLVALAKGKHSSFLVLALLRHGSAADKAAMLGELRPHARALGTHGSAARVVNYALSADDVFASPRDKERFTEMFYGNEVLLQGVGASGLAGKAALLSNPSALSTMKQALIKMADKGLLRFPYAQRLLCEYLGVCTADDVRYMTPNVREAALAMVGTWEGAIAVVAVLAASDAKERKRLVKEWRGHVVDLAAHQFAWLVLAKALALLDDTVLVGKAIVDELVESDQLLALLLQREGHARKVLLSVVAAEERVQGYYADSDRDALFKPEPHSTSLKPSAQRRAEVGAKLVPALLQCMTAGADAEDGADSALLQVLTSEGARTLPSDVLRECLAWPEADGRAEACTRLAAAAESVMEHPKAHLVLKRIVKDEVALGASLPTDSFGSKLAVALAGRMAALSEVSRACFVLAELAKHPHAAKAVKAELKKAKLTSDSAGCVALKAALLA